MKEAISKYTALEVLHVVGPEGRSRREAPDAATQPCWTALDRVGPRSRCGSERGALEHRPRVSEEKGSLGGFRQGGVCTDW